MYTFRKPQECAMRKADIFFQALTWPPEVTTEHYGQSNTNFVTYSDSELDPHQNTPRYPQMIHGTFPEPFRNHSGKTTKI